MGQKELRNNVITAIYSVRMQEESHVSFEYKDILSDIFSCPWDEIPLFARELYVVSISHSDEAEKKFDEKLTRWKFSRLNKVLQAILIVAYSERNVISDTDRRVVINESVEYSKIYGDAKDYKLVNSVLDKVLN
ncbi:MAG TPA: hypothetical protein DCY93_00325 [Firmicutes bacterium]|nr:hypothetical protein [Bacillota bacterium]